MKFSWECWKIIYFNFADMKSQNPKVDDIPNTLTLAAMKESESGKDVGVVSMDCLDDFIASMM